jgi:hypothetical protein
MIGIKSISPTTGKAGDTLTINVSGYSAYPGVKVTIGTGAGCTLASNTLSTITCVIGAGSGTNQPVRVWVGDDVSKGVPFSYQ